MSNLGLVNGLLLLMLLKSTGIGAAAAFANSYSRYDFPPTFVFGSGTTAYQVEGAAKQDGRTPSIWDTYAHSGDGPGGDADIACDQYHKYKEDVKLMVDVGLDAYRFSISWSRLIPNGRGAINPKGLEYYNNLINELITHGIQPHVTLHNFDLPQALEDEYGGWVSPKIIEDFKAYAEVCFREFGDRVLHWSTINEANVFALGGYDLGFLPPQRCSPPFGTRNCSKGNSSTEPYLVVHHCLLAHASAASLYKNNYKDKQHGFVGISIYMFRFVPFTESKEDAKAVERAYEFLVNWVLHPLVFGEYPNLMKKNVGSKMPIFSDDESSLVKGSADFIGIIHYQNWHIKDDPYSFMMETRDLGADMGAKAIMLHENVTTPESLQMVIEYLKQVYGNPPSYVYENGLPMKRDSWLKDEPRVEYMHAYIGAVLDALRTGSNVKGYFSWSFLDVFELLDGYDSSYGLFYVDFNDPNLKRYSKFSAQWFSNFLKGEGKVAHSNGVLELKNNQTTLPSSSYYSNGVLELKNNQTTLPSSSYYSNGVLELKNNQTTLPSSSYYSNGVLELKNNQTTLPSSSYYSNGVLELKNNQTTLPSSSYYSNGVLELKNNQTTLPSSSYYSNGVLELKNNQTTLPSSSYSSYKLLE